MSEFVDCRTCKTDCVRADGNYGYTFCDKYTHPPMTNADRIRSMSDEKLKDWYCKNRDCGGCDFCRPFGCAFKDWLQRPAEDADHENL